MSDRFEKLADEAFESLVDKHRDALRAESKRAYREGLRAGADIIRQVLRPVTNDVLARMLESAALAEEADK